MKNGHVWFEVAEDAFVHAWHVVQAAAVADFIVVGGQDGETFLLWTAYWCSMVVLGSRLQMTSAT